MKRLVIITMALLFFCANFAFAKQDSLSLNLQKIATYAADNNWPLALQTVSNSPDKPFSTAALTALRIYYKPNDFSVKELIEFFNKNPWLPVSSFKSSIDKSMDEERSYNDILKWYETYKPSTSYGRLMYLLAKYKTESTDSLTEFKDAWINSKLDVNTDKYFIAALPSQMGVNDILKKIEFYTWNDSFAGADALIKTLPAHVTTTAKARINLAKKPNLLKKFLNTSENFKETDELTQFLAVKFLLDNDYEDHASKLIKHIKTGVNSEKWFRVRNALARENISKGRFDDAYAIISNHGLKEGNDYVEAEFLSGWLANQFIDRRDLAVQHFENMLKHASQSSSKAKANYWLGKSLEGTGKYDKSQEYFKRAADYKGTFYGHLAMAMVHGKVSVDYFNTAPDLDKKELAILSSNVNKLAAFASALDKANISFLSKKIIDSMVELEPDTKTLKSITKYFYSQKQRSLAVELSKVAANKYGILLEDGYPNEFPVKQKLENKAVYLGIIRQESNFNQAAVSSRGARGLMQLMPKTAERVAKKLGLPKRAYEKDSGANILKGATYFNELYANFGNNYMLAICAYNAGPGNVKKWLTKYGDPRGQSLDYIIDWVELIPFSETRLYIKKVIENIVVYDSMNSDDHMANSIYKFLNYE